ncbi:MAG: hypothetical protein K2N40_01605, partial [Ureaplasma sp.]|nr:hypothetical protein [Ureaplasma sp.]
RINTTSGMNSCSNVQKLQKLLNCSITTLLNNLNKLSAINLIQIFSNGAKLIIKLFPPLEYSEFINNCEFKQLLIKNIGKFNYENLQYYYNHEVIPNDYLLLDSSLDVFEKIDSIHSNNNIHFDWNKITSKLIVMFNKRIKISDECKNIILENYFYNLLNENNLYDVIYKSSICQNDLCELDAELLVNSINQIKDNFEFTKNISLHRNYAIFDINKNIDDCKLIIEDYKKFNTHNYLLLLTKSSLAPNISHMIKSIKSNLDLPESFINVVCDYSIYKNSGRIEPNYIYKLCSTINNLGFDDINNVILYLRYVSQNMKIPTSLFNSKIQTLKDKSEVDTTFISFDEIANNLGKNNE